MSLIENIRSINTCKKHGIQMPKIVEKNDFFYVEIIRPIQIEKPSGKSFISTDYDRLNIEERKLLLYLLDNEKITRKQGVDLLKLRESKIKDLFNSLLTKGLIVRRGQGRSTYYTLAR
jgi:ATP-dependent DNA helicase RecG